MTPALVEAKPHDPPNEVVRLLRSILVDTYLRNFFPGPEIVISLLPAGEKVAEGRMRGRR